MGNSHSIQGSWRGRYYYPGSSEAHGFEAVFVDVDGIVEGNILDDGSLGEAAVGGKFSYPLLKFVKVYQKGGQHPVNYQGTMSEDGKTLMGRWKIAGANSGTWTAKRYEDGEDLKFETEDDRELEAAGEKRHETAPASTGKSG